MISSDMTPSYYAVLNVAKDASDEDIKRSYRHLVQTYHPDKHADTALQAGAASNFTLLQEAYEVLCNPGKRQIYDIYGKEGLTAGFEVGTNVNKDELKRQWAEFKSQEAGAKKSEAMQYKGIYTFRFNAETLIRPYDKMLSRVPESTGASMNTAVQITLPKRTVATIGGRIDVQQGRGQGSMLVGLQHAISHLCNVEAQANIAGPQSSLSLQTSYQLTKHMSASIAGTLQPGAGPGLQASCSRKLSERSKGEATVVLGPPHARGVSVSMTTQHKLCLTNVGMEVGAQTMLSGRVIYKKGKRSVYHASARAGFNGASVELGGRYKWSDLTSTGLTLRVGNQGIVYLVSLNSGDHRIEVPIVLCSDLDPKVLFWAGITPPLVIYSFSRFLLRPLRRRHKLKKALELARVNAKAVKAAYSRACESRDLMEPVAARKLREETRKGGLVIISARYGTKAAIREVEAEAKQKRHQRHLSDSQRQRSDLEDTANLEEEPTPASEHGSQSDEEEVEEEDQEVQEAADAVMTSELPPSCLDVTIALRYMVEHSCVDFHQDIPKSGLMGFFDTAPGQHKELKVLFLYNKEPCWAVLGDEEGGSLPYRGKAVMDNEVSQDMLADFEEQQQ